MRFLNLLAQTDNATTTAAAQAPQAGAEAAQAAQQTASAAQPVIHMATREGFSLLDLLFFPARSTEYAGGVDDLFMFVFWVCVVFFVLVMGPYAYFIIKYRRKPGVPAQRSVSHNTPLELTWSIGPLFLLAVMFFWGFEEYVSGQIAPVGAEEIRVKGYKWNWEFEYDNGAATKQQQMIAAKEVPVFAIPANRPVRLILDSRDVIHSFFVPDFRKKIDIYPNRFVTMWFQPMTAGKTHYVFCAEYCGDGHSLMGALLNVLPEHEYLEWKQNNLFDSHSVPPYVWGGMLFRAKGCNACHSVDGSKNTGPTWLGIYGKSEALQGGGSVMVDENYIRESILTPAVKIVQGFPNQMTPYAGQLTDREIDALIAYIKSLSEIGQAQLKAAEEAATKEGADAPAQPPAPAPTP